IRKGCLGTRAGRTCYSLAGAERNLETPRTKLITISDPFRPELCFQQDERARPSQIASEAKRFRPSAVPVPMRGHALGLAIVLALVAHASAAQLAEPMQIRNLNPLVAIFGLPAWDTVAPGNRFSAS